MDCQTSFSRFPRLPPELQDIIWAFVLDAGSPAVHYAALKRVRSGYITRRPLEFWRGLPPSFTDTRPPWTILDTLLRTCHRSRVLAIQHRQRFPPSQTIELLPYELPVPNLRGGCVGLGQPRSNKLTTIRLPSSSLDSSSDLMILGDGWNFGELNDFCIWPLITTIRHFAVQWHPEIKDPHTQPPTISCLHILLNAMPDLEVLYAVIEPAQLEAAKEDWPSYRPGTNTDLQKYLEDHYSEPGGHGPFYAMGREYFEIPPERIASMGGLVHFVHIFRELRYKRERRWNRVRNDDSIPLRKDTVGLRFMSWRTQECGHIAPV